MNIFARVAGAALVACVFVGVIGCSSGKPSSTAPAVKPSLEKRFWDWFGKNTNRLAAVKTCHERVCDELAVQMHKINKHLTFVFGPVKDGRREFIVSADGILSAFPAVKNLVAAAPDIPGWRIIAFRQPDSISARIRIDDHELGSEDIWFTASPNGDKFDIHLLIKGATEDDNALMQLAFIVLDHTLGEYCVETKLGRIGLGPLPDDPAASGLKPLLELADVVNGGNTHD
ncbi:MAG: hypothetical protein NT018_06895 [Armatimonadetes bacterium]|nr:hypothetical protein [Armatimonadota bacterium]